MSTCRAPRWTDYLRRRTTGGRWLPEIDGLRCLAIGSVLLFHIQGQLERHYTGAVPHTWLARAAGFGNRGVPLFFVLSGFILSLPFARGHLQGGREPSLRRYFFRRLTRLEAPYLVNLIAVAVGAAVFNQQRVSDLLPHLIASGVYLYYAIFRTPSTINSVAWSLEVEAQFYLLAPLLALVFAMRGVAWRRLLLLAGMGASAALQLAFRLSQFTLAGDLAYFLAGLLLADLYLARMQPTSGKFSWDVVAMAGWPAFFLFPDRWTTLWLPGLAVLLCTAGLRGAVLSRALRLPGVAITGGMCYTIYLWHAPVLTVIDRLLQAHVPRLAQLAYPELLLAEAAVKTLAVALVCLPLFVVIERPCMDPQWPATLAARLYKPRVAPVLPAADGH